MEADVRVRFAVRRVLPAEFPGVFERLVDSEPTRVPAGFPRERSCCHAASGFDPLRISTTQKTLEALASVFRCLASLRNPGRAVESVAPQRLFAPILASRHLELHGLLCLEAISGSVCGIRDSGASLPRARPEGPIWRGCILHFANPYASFAWALV